MNRNLSLSALILCALCAVLIGALTALHDPIPDVLNLLAIGALTGGAGLAVPPSTETVRTSSSTSTARGSVPAQRPAAAPASSSVL